MAVWPELLQSVTNDIREAIIITRRADQSTEADAALYNAGFTRKREETVWRLPLAAVLTKPRARTVHKLVSVDTLDAERVARLDNSIRHDIPGTEQWQGTGADLLATLDDPEFDPALFRIALNPTTGSLDGLIRVWNRSPEPRLGCIGVTRPWRRTRLALALLQDVTSTLHARGVTHILAGTDTTNRNSHHMAIRQGGETVMSTIEWWRDAKN